MRNERLSRTLDDNKKKFINCRSRSRSGLSQLKWCVTADG